MGAVYATVADVMKLKPLTAQQQEAAADLLVEASAKLRIQGKQVGKDVDDLVLDEDYAQAVKAVVVQAVIRALDTVGGNSAISQGSETLGAYSYSMTYVGGGQSLYFLRNELKDLGLYRVQSFGALDVYRIHCYGEPPPPNGGGV